MGDHFAAVTATMAAFVLVIDSATEKRPEK